MVSLPIVAFFAGGQEVASARLSGFEPPKAFLERLDRVAVPPAARP